MLRRVLDERSPLLAGTPHFVIDINQIRAESTHVEPLDSAITKLTEIEINQRPKYIPVYIGSVLSVSAIALFTYAMVSLSKLRGLRPDHIPRPDFMLNYTNAVIARINSTCGEQFPLVNLCDFSQYTESADWKCSDLARAMCDPQQVAKQFYSEIISGLNSTCAQLYPLNNFCNWHSIVGPAHECFLQARDLCQDASSSTSSELLTQYLNTTLADAIHCPDITPMTNVTCGTLLPLKDVCDWPGFMDTVSYHCADLAHTACSSFTPLFDQYNTVITNTSTSCNDLHPLTDYCDWKSIIGDAYNCSVSAAAKCDAQNAWRDPYNTYSGPEFWSSGRIWFLVGSIIGLLLAFCAALILLRVTCCLKPVTKVSDLPDNDRNELTKLATDTHVEINTTTSIMKSLKTFENKQDEIVQKQIMLKKVQSTLLSALKESNKDSPMHYLLRVKDVARIIFHYAGLFVPKVRPELPINTDENNENRAVMEV